MEPTNDIDFPSPTGPYNVAGIIPLAGYENQYGTIWPDYINPIGQGFFPIHKSVMECAFAGCDTIWVVCNGDFTPLVKKYIGESVVDPISYQDYYITKSGARRYKRKTIPIMYMSMHNKHLANCNVPFSALYGAHMIKKIANRMSKWNKPDKYFVSFTNHIYNMDALYPVRKNIKSPNPFFVSHNTKTVLDGVYSSFTFDNDDLNVILRFNKLKRNHPIQEVFSGMDTQDSFICEPKYSFDIKTWAGLREYLGSPDTENHKVMNSIFSDFKFKPLYRETKNVIV
jgi:hypothetical protein